MSTKLFTPFELLHIEYTRKDGTGKTQRYIIPTFIPTPAMKAVDVTELSEEARVELLSLLKEYADYYEAATKRVFSFEDWLSHTTGLSEDTVNVKWRTFLLENTKLLD